MIKPNVAGEIPADLDTEPIQAVVAALNRAVTSPDGNINLRLVDDAAIARLNQQYSGQAKATDVLSFSYIENGAEPIGGDLGDVAISRETAARQAQEAGTDLATEVALLVLHGCLHILGYDHAEPAARQQLDRLQASVMAAAHLTYRNFQWHI